MADNLRTPPEVTKLGKAAAIYFDTINRLLNAQAGATAAVVEVPLGTSVRRATLSVALDSYLLDTTGTGTPTGFIRHQGQTLNRADYPDLFTAFGIPVGTDTATISNDTTLYMRVL